MSDTSRSSNTQTIDVIVVVDAANIALLSGANTSTSATPVAIPQDSTAANYVDLLFAITQQSQTLSGNGSDNMVVGARTGDVIRWRLTTSANNSLDYTALLYEAVPVNPLSIVLSYPKTKSVNFEGMVPTPPVRGVPQPPHPEQLVDYFYQTNAQKAGDDTSIWKFMIYEKETLLGFFSWHQKVTIRN